MKLDTSPARPASQDLQDAYPGMLGVVAICAGFVVLSAVQRCVDFVLRPSRAAAQDARKPALLRASSP